MLRRFLKKPKIRWTGTTGGEVIRPHEVAESEEKDIEKTSVFYAWYGIF